MEYFTNRHYPISKIYIIQKGTLTRHTRFLWKKMNDLFPPEGISLRSHNGYIGISLLQITYAFQAILTPECSRIRENYLSSFAGIHEKDECFYGRREPEKFRLTGKIRIL